MAAIRFENVSKSYPIYDSPGDRLKELVTFNRLEFHRNFWALHDVSFEVARGETFCVIGENGSGKSTLLQLVAGILQPSSGTIEVNGRVSALLELGAGFNPEFTGRDNVYLNGAILGLSTREIDAHRGSTKRAKGATLAEIVDATGWQNHTVRGFVSILGSKGGERIESAKNAAGERTYRIAK